MSMVAEQTKQGVSWPEIKIQSTEGVTLEIRGVSSRDDIRKIPEKYTIGQLIAVKGFGRVTIRKVIMPRRRRVGYEGDAIITVECDCPQGANIFTLGHNARRPKLSIV